jgi:TRAP-type mannitol/chloroaromatic compound transport system permease large subunit
VGRARVRESASGLPVAAGGMSAFYLKGVSPKHVTLNQIFAGMMPYMLVIILCMIIMYL